MYRQELGDFRNNTLPRQVTRSFQETPESNIIRNLLTDLNGRFEKLKLRSGKHGKTLQELVERHQAYHDKVTGTSTWLGQAEKTLDTLQKEPIGVKADSIIRQIQKVKVSHYCMTFESLFNSNNSDCYERYLRSHYNYYYY